MLSTKHKWVKFILGQCQHPSAALSLRAQAYTEYGRIYPVSFPVLPSDVSLTLLWYASMLLSILLPGTFWMQLCLSRPVFLYDALFCLSSHIPSLCLDHIQPADRSTLLCVMTARSPSLQAACQCAAAPSTPFLTTQSRGSVFCCSWSTRSKSFSFSLSVCDENSEGFFFLFQREVLVLASAQPQPLLLL